MKKKIKVVMSMMLALVLSLALFVGCGPRATGEGELKISIFLGGYGQKWAVKLGEKFMDENPGIVVKVNPSPDLLSEIPIELETQGDTDIFFSHGISWERAASEGKIANLNDLYESEVVSGVKFKDRVEKDLIDTAKFRGKGDADDNNYYKVPWTNGVGGLVYNEVLFAKHGWVVPTTYDELYALCEKIEADAKPTAPGSRDNVVPFAYSSEIYYWDYVVFDWMTQLCGVDKINETRALTSSALFDPSVEGSMGWAQKEATALWNDLVGKKPTWSLPDSAGTKYTAAQMNFLNGKAAMMPNAQWIENEMLASLDPATCVMRIMPTPYADGAKTDAEGNKIQVSRAIGAGDSIIIPSHSPDVALAKKFLSFIAREDNAKLFMEYTSGAMLAFEYPNIEGVKTTPFINDVYSINSKSSKYHTANSNPLVLSGNIPRFEWFVNDWSAPYLKLVEDPSLDIDGMYTSSYASIASNWQKWVDSIN